MAVPDTSSPTVVLDSHEEGIAPIAVTGEWGAAALVSEPLPRTIARVGLPAVASMLLMTLFFTVDTFWIGRYLGPVALAAAAASVFWIWLIVSIAELVSIGLTSVAAQRHGARRADEAARCVRDGIAYSILLGLTTAALGILLLPYLFGLMDVSPRIAAFGHAYLGTWLAGAPLFFGFFAVDAGFRASGDTRTPLTILSISVAVTLVLDPVLILGLWGAPRLGIAGAAVSSVATRTIAFAIGVVVLRRRGMVRWGPPRARIIGAITRVGLPTAVTGVVFALIYVALTRSIAPFGSTALGALGIGHRVESWLYTVSLGFGAAVAAIVGQNIGAGEWRRAAHTGWLTVGYVLVPAVVLSAVELVAARHLGMIFTRDPGTLDRAEMYLRLSAFSNLFLGAEIVLEAALGGAGATLPPMLTSTTITALRVPLAAWGAARWGLIAVWWVIILTAAGRGIAMALLWRSGFWQRRRSGLHAAR